MQGAWGGLVCLVLKWSRFHPGPYEPPAALLWGEGGCGDCCPHASFTLPGPAAQGAPGTKATVTRAPCPSVTPPPPPVASPQLPGPWENHSPTAAPRQPAELPHAAAPSCRGSLTLRYPACGGPASTPASGSLCTLAAPVVCSSGPCLRRGPWPAPSPCALWPAEGPAP